MVSRVTASLGLVFVLLGVIPVTGQITGPAGAISEPPSPLERMVPAHPRLREGLVIKGDMILDTSRVSSTPDVSSPAGASYETYFARPWEFGVLPVDFDAPVTDNDRVRFWAACDTWKSAGVICVAHTNEPTWVRVYKDDDGCYSEVGMDNRAGAQVLNLALGCWSQGTIAHEIGHSFGLIHEHQRADRDTYVTINWKNVDFDYVDQFDVYVTGRLWTPYDFDSLMHYSKTAFSNSGLDTITPKPEYVSAAARMGQRSAPSSLDLQTMTTIYNLPPRVFRTYTPISRTFTMGRDEAVAAMSAISGYYTAPQGLARAEGLAIGGRPDFLGLAAWFFDVYVNTRYAGYAEVESRYNVMANITQTDEWRVKHPGQPSAVPFSVGNALPFDRSELLAVMERLDRFYQAPEGLQRPQGLSLNGQPDFLGIAAWVVDVYLGGRFSGLSPDDSWQRVVAQIRQTDEWKGKH